MITTLVKNKVVVVIVLVVFLPPLTRQDWTSECVTRYPASCRCTWSSGKRLADCSKSDMSSLPVLSNEIQILDMSNNKITQLQDNVFTNANMINLQKLYLKGCRINRVHELAFNNLRILVEIDLSFNEIEFIDPIIFSTNARLQKIKLNNNRLHTIREFPTLEYLNTVDLSHNQLTNLSYHTFAGLRMQREKLRLDLGHNQFTNINPAIFPPLGELSLRGNAWICDCELKALRDYVVAEKFYESELRCSEPLNLYNSPWDAFDELSCKPEILHILANGKIVDSIVALENTLVLSCVVKGDPLPDVKWVKGGRVVEEAKRSGHHDVGGGVVVLNLTVDRNDNEFVCVGSNSGGVVERNLTVTLDEAGLSGFVVLKDGVESGLNTGGVKDRGGLLIYLVIGVVFLSLIVGLVVGGVCVWRWGQRGGRQIVEQDSVVKGVLKDNDDRGGGGLIPPPPPDDDNDNINAQQREFLVEQTITGSASSQQQHTHLLHPLHPHHHHHHHQNHPPPPPSYYTDHNNQQQHYYARYSTYSSNNRNDYGSNYRYYDYDDTLQQPHHHHHPQATLTLRSKVHPNEMMYDTVVYSRVHSSSSPTGNTQSPLLKPHASADDLLDTMHPRYQRPTPDLLINNQQQQRSPEEEEEVEELYSKFPNENSSVYDNYELVYRPLLTPTTPDGVSSGGGVRPTDALRRYCFTRDYTSTMPHRPSSVCSEPRGLVSASPLNLNSYRGGSGGGGGVSSNSPVIFPSHHGYVTLPRRSLHRNTKNKEPPIQQPLPIKYDNLGPRTTADGSSTISLNDDALPNNHFEPIIEHPIDEEEQQQSTPIDQLPHSNGFLSQGAGEMNPKKFRPVPPPKPKKKQEQPPPTPPPPQDDDDGTEV